MTFLPYLPSLSWQVTVINKTRKKKKFAIKYKKEIQQKTELLPVGEMQSFLIDQSGPWNLFRWKWEVKLECRYSQSTVAKEQ